jgi:hypothetical protein
MKKIKGIILLFVGIFTVGCSVERLSCGSNEIICDLNKAGINENNVAKIVFVGSEANFGSIRVEIKDPEKIKKVWDMLHHAGLGGKAYACGYVWIEFYKSFQELKPSATLTVWCGNDGIVQVKESQRKIYDEKNGKWLNPYKCTGLEDYVIAELEKEYKKTKQ